MASGNVIAQIHEGMEVHFADGARLGKIAQVWIGTDPASSATPCDEDVCSRLEIHRRDATLYIPYSAIAGVSGNIVTLNVDTAMANEKGWHRPPAWITQESASGGLGPTNVLHT